MPSSLSDALDRLAKESEALSQASWVNNVASGPFTTAYLDPSVLNLVRDADESERQPFRRLLDDRFANLTAGPSKPTPASVSAPTPAPARGHRQQAGQHERQRSMQPEHLLTPLRELPRVRNTPHELSATLNALEDVISSLNESFPLKRARNEARSLAHAHDAQRARIAELERLIEEARRPRRAESPSPPEPEEDEPMLSVDDAIAAEEDALRALEASLVPLRREHALRNAAQRSPMSPKFPSSSRRGSSPSRTPKSPSTSVSPRKALPLPMVTNSLVQGSATPLPASTAHTPRPGAGGLRSSTSHEPRSIFGPARKTMTPSRLGPLAAFSTPGYGATPRAPRFEFAPTPRVPAPSLSTRLDDVVPTPVPARPRDLSPSPSPSPPRSPTPTPVAAPPPHVPSSPPPPPPPAEPAEPVGPRMVDGVEIDHPAIPGAIAQVWTCLEPVMRTAASSPIARTPDATLAHLTSLSRRDPDSSTTPAITTDTILLAHIVLVLLRGVRTGQQLGASAVQLAELKADLAAVARARAWDAPEDLASKIIYRALGFKIVTIIRREGGKLVNPKVQFVFPDV